MDQLTHVHVDEVFTNLESFSQRIFGCIFSEVEVLSEDVLETHQEWFTLSQKIEDMYRMAEQNIITPPVTNDAYGVNVINPEYQTANHVVANSFDDKGNVLTEPNVAQPTVRNGMSAGVAALVALGNKLAEAYTAPVTTTVAFDIENLAEENPVVVVQNGTLVRLNRHGLHIPMSLGRQLDLTNFPPNKTYSLNGFYVKAAQDNTIILANAVTNPGEYIFIPKDRGRFRISMPRLVYLLNTNRTALRRNNAFDITVNGPHSLVIQWRN